MAILMTGHGDLGGKETNPVLGDGAGRFKCGFFFSSVRTVGCVQEHLEDFGCLEAFEMGVLLTLLTEPADTSN
ncbi:hypothetical protein Taro_002348 [Colocasia esculenta]|uniref:Uncharacterized protein n=1 Tax=Colocasia esculenta TaxID=4460 RepID=A0A843TLA2_COLES|nr:hypothetical protein [Colocasia esculenta]